jgi:hypothetical protein
MSNGMIAIIDDTAKRRKANTEWSEECLVFGRWCIQKLKDDGREVTPVSFKDYMILFGPTNQWFEGMEGFVYAIWGEIGNKRDIIAFLSQEGYEFKEEQHESGNQDNEVL